MKSWQMKEEGKEVKWLSGEESEMEQMNTKEIEINLGEKYEIEAVVGRGTSGIVWKAYDRHLNRTVAIKQFQAEAAEAQWEAMMLKELQHPAFPTVLDFIKGETVEYLVMEYVHGQNLADYIEENGEVEQEQAVRWALELAEVLLYLHERKRPVLYRDMKPENIIIEETGRVRLIDVGTVCYRYEEGEQEVKMAGSKGYAAPEQLEVTEWRKVDERCDIYSLGATLFHMLTGHHPSKPPFLLQPIRSYDRRLSVGLEKIVAKATAKEKEKRYATVRALKRELERYKAKDRMRRMAQMIGAALYYGHLALGAGVFFRYWGRAEQYLASAGHLYLRLSGVKALGESLTVLDIACTAMQQAAERKMLSAAFFLMALCLGKYLWERWNRRGIRAMRQERNVVLTQKKNRGVFLLMIAILLSGAVTAGETVLAQEEPVRENTLFVTVRNEAGQKLIIRYDAEYPLTDTLRLELPLENFEEGERYELRLDCTNRKTGESHSRIFYLKGLEP